MNPDLVKLAVDGIKIVHEAANDSEEYQKACEYMRTASRVFFLGFGYSKTNVDRLRMDMTSSSVQLFGTCCKMGVAEMCDVVNAFLPKSLIMTRLPEQDIMSFFRESYPL